MKIQIISDIHLEFNPNFKLLKNDAEILIVAGDLSEGIDGINFLKGYKKDYKKIIYVLGNHEFYNQNISKLSINIKEYAKEHDIIILDNDTLVYENVLFIGSTLWSDFKLYGNDLAKIGKAMNYSYNYINDFSNIRYAYEFFKPSYCASLGIQSQKFIEKKLQDEKYKDLKKVVITHFAPSIQSIHEKYKDSELNPYFANNLDNLIKWADIWVHGHVHNKFRYNVDKCEVICNPLGYGDYENTNFENNLIINI